MDSSMTMSVAEPFASVKCVYVHGCSNHCNLMIYKGCVIVKRMYTGSLNSSFDLSFEIVDVFSTDCNLLMSNTVVWYQMLILGLS